MIKKLIRQEVFKRDSTPQKMLVEENDPETPRSNRYEGGSSDDDIENSVYEPNYFKRDNALQISQNIEIDSNCTSQQEVQIEIPRQLIADFSGKDIQNNRDKSPYQNI
jgi:hypothetical protein